MVLTSALGIYLQPDCHPA